MRQRWVIAASAAAVAALAISGCSSSSSKGGSSGSSTAASSSAPTVKTTDASKAQSAADLGGMDALVAAANKEGALNIIAVPRTWAGYGAIIDAFTAKYPAIKINSENPDGSSGDEINALKSTKGQASAPGRRRRR